MRKQLAVVAASCALLAACGGDSEPPSAAVAAAAPTTIAAPAADTFDTATPDVWPTEMMQDLIYHLGVEPFAAKSGKIDVIIPAGKGPFQPSSCSMGIPALSPRDGIVRTPNSLPSRDASCFFRPGGTWTQLLCGTWTIRQSGT